MRCGARGSGAQGSEALECQAQESGPHRGALRPGLREVELFHPLLLNNTHISKHGSEFHQKSQIKIKQLCLKLKGD